MSDDTTTDTTTDTDNRRHGQLAWKGKHEQRDDVRMFTSSSSDGDQWFDQHDVGKLDRGTSCGPALIGGPSGLMAWRGISPDSQLWYATPQGGQDWSPQHALGKAFRSSHGPALAAVGESVMIAFKGDGAIPSLYSSIYDGRSWSPPQRFSEGGSSHGPALAASGRGKVYAAWKGNGNDPRLFWAHYENGAWSAQKDVAAGTFGTTDQPALAWFGDHIVMAWKGKLSDGVNDERLFWSALRGGIWSPQRVVDDHGGGSSAGPALAEINGRLTLAWKGKGADPQIWLSTYDGNSWLPQRKFLNGAAGTSHTPALASYVPWNL